MPKDLRDQLAPDLRHPDSAAPYLTTIADGYHLLPVSPRLKGFLTMRPGETGELVLHVSFVVAYAFDPGSEPVTGPSEIEPFLRTEGDFVLRTTAAFTKASAGMWPQGLDESTCPVGCADAVRGYVSPGFTDRQFDGPSYSVEPGDFDPGKPMPAQDGCH